MMSVCCCCLLEQDPARESQQRSRKTETAIPYLWFMLAIIGLVLLGILWLVLTGQ